MSLSEKQKWFDKILPLVTYDQKTKEYVISASEMYPLYFEKLGISDAEEAHTTFMTDLNEALITMPTEVIVRVEGSV